MKLKSLLLAALCGALLLPATLQAAKAKKWNRTTHEVNLVISQETSKPVGEGVFKIQEKTKGGKVVPGWKFYFKVQPGVDHEATVKLTPEADGKGWLLLRSFRGGNAEFKEVTLNGKPLISEPMTFDGARRDDKPYYVKFNRRVVFKAGEEQVFKFKLATPEAAPEAAPAAEK